MVFRITMDQSLRALLDHISVTPSDQNQLAGIDPHLVKQYIISETEAAIPKRDWERWCALLQMSYFIEDEQIQAETLGNLLLMPGHDRHQEITRDMQDLGHPASIPYIGKMLETQYAFLTYTCSEDQVITKWFSHALADIGTPEAIAMMCKFALSPNRGIARGMRYRLQRIRKR